MVNYSASTLDGAFQALADPTRRVIVERLTLGPATVSELAAPLPMSMPAVLGHLKVLELSGLIMSHKEGRVRTCRMQPDALSATERWIAERQAAWEGRFDRLARLLADDAGVPGNSAPTVTSSPADHSTPTDPTTPTDLEPR